MSDSSSLEPLYVRLYFDRHIIRRLAVDLQAQSFDVLTTEEARKDTASDADQLVFSTLSGRAILTYNIRDFAKLHAEFPPDIPRHGGIIVSRQLGRREYGVLLKRMLRLLNKVTAEEISGQLLHLEQFK